MLSAPRVISACAVGAATEKGTSLSCCSRSIAVTVTASSVMGCTTRSSETVAPAATCTSLDTVRKPGSDADTMRSEEHTSELQSPCNLVCRLLLEKKKKQTQCVRTYRCAS